MAIKTKRTSVDRASTPAKKAPSPRKTASEKPAHTTDMTSFALSRDGRYLASGSGVGDDATDPKWLERGSVAIWELASGRVVRRIAKLHAGVGWDGFTRQLQFTGDGSRLGVGFNTATVGVWTTEGSDNDPLGADNVTSGWSRPAAWCLSPDGEGVFVSCGGEPVDEAVRAPGRIFDVRGRTEYSDPARAMAPLPKLRIKELGKDGLQSFTAVVWSADGRRLVGHSKDRYAYALDASTGELQWLLPIADAAACSADGAVVAYVRDGELVFVDGSTGKTLGATPVPPNVAELVWAPDGKRLAAIVAADDGRISREPGVLLFEVGKQVAAIDSQVRAHRSRPCADLLPFAFSANGKNGALLNADGSIESWDLAGTKPKKLGEWPAFAGADGVFFGSDVIVAASSEQVSFQRTDAPSTETVADSPPTRSESQTPVTPKRERVAPIVWYMSFDVAAKSSAGAELKRLLLRFKKELKRSGYVIVDDGDTAAIAEGARESVMLTVSELARAMSKDASESERRAHLDRVLHTPSAEAWHEIDMLLSTWPEAQRPADAVQHAGKALARWPSDLRQVTLQSERAAAKGDLTLHRALVRAESLDIDGATAAQFETTTKIWTDKVATFLGKRARMPEVRELELRSIPTVAEWKALAKIPLAHLGVLYDEDVSKEKRLDASSWADAPLGKNLRSLRTFQIDVASTPALADVEGALKHLSFSFAKLGKSGRMLSSYARNHPLESLELTYSELNDAAAAAVFQPGSLASLRALELSSNPLADGAAEAIASSPDLGKLEFLAIKNNDHEWTGITAAGAGALAKAKSLGALRSLDLSQHQLGTEGAAALLASKALPSLRALQLSRTGVVWADLITRLTSMETVPLTHLDASYWEIGKRVAWRKATFLRSITHLTLSPFDEAHVGPFLMSGHLEALQVLVLGDTYSDRAANKVVEALLDAPALPTLRVISVGTPFTVPQAKSLVKAPLFRGGVALHPRTNAMTANALKVFVDAGVQITGSPEFEYLFATELLDFKDFSMLGP